MGMRYFCDLCGKDIPKASNIHPRPIGQITIIDPKAPNPPSESNTCVDCTPKLQTFIDEQQKKNGVIPVSKDLNLNIKK